MSKPEGCGNACPGRTPWGCIVKGSMLGILRLRANDSCKRRIAQALRSGLRMDEYLLRSACSIDQQKTRKVTNSEQSRRAGHPFDSCGTEIGPTKPGPPGSVHLGWA